jgi:hypothetical protein
MERIAPFAALALGLAAAGLVAFAPATAFA